jgi:hypothetical protein
MTKSVWYRGCEGSDATKRKYIKEGIDSRRLNGP